MKKMSVPDRIFILLAGLLAAYQIVFGIEGAPPLSIWAYTIAFGTLLLAGLLMIIFGFEVLDNPLVTVVSTILPLALSLGLVWEHWPAWRNAYLVFVILGFVAVAFTRFYRPESKAAVITLAVVHSVAGLLIFLLPIYMSLRGLAPIGFVLVGIGGALIGVGGLLLAFLKMGKPVISRQTILTILPLLLLLMTTAYVVGFHLG